MRAIKFQAWHKELKKMFSAEEMGRDQLTLMPDGRGFANISGKNTRLSQIDNGNKMIPLQYTGLRDRNGVEIYEGYIVKDPIHMGMWLVEWATSIAGFHLRLVQSPVQDMLQLLSAERIVDFEFIGNIYENPELKEG